MTARPSSFSESVHVVTADRIARFVVAGVGLCEQSGVPLSERQRVALLTAALLEFDGVQAEVDGLREVEHMLQELRDWNARPHA